MLGKMIAFIGQFFWDDFMLELETERKTKPEPKHTPTSKPTVNCRKQSGMN